MKVLLAAAATALFAASVAWQVFNRSPWRVRPALTKAPSDGRYGDVSSLRFWSTSVAAGLAAFLVVLAVTRLPVVAAVPAVVVATMPNVYFTRRRSKRLASVQKAWPDGLRDIVASVRSGASLSAAIEDLSRNGPLPLREAFAGFDVFARSLGVVAALEMVQEDLADPTSDRVLEILILAQERGGSVVPQILGDLADATTRDLWTMEQVRNEALEQKINARIVFVLPWIVLLVMTARSGAFREFYSTSTGAVVVILGGVLSIVGMIVVSRLGSQPVEPRVLGKSR